MILLPCTLAHMSSIPMGAMYLYMHECFLHSLIPLLFPWLPCIYMQECSVARSYVFYTHGCNVRAWNLFWASSQTGFVKLWQLMILLPNTCKPACDNWWFYCPKYLLICLLFLWVQCIYTCKNVFYTPWYDLIPLGAPIFTVINEV